MARLDNTVSNQLHLQANWANLLRDWSHRPLGRVLAICQFRMHNIPTLCSVSTLSGMFCPGELWFDFETLPIHCKRYHHDISKLDCFVLADIVFKITDEAKAQKGMREKGNFHHRDLNFFFQLFPCNFNDQLMSQTFRKGLLLSFHSVNVLLSRKL